MNNKNKNLLCFSGGGLRAITAHTSFVKAYNKVEATTSKGTSDTSDTSDMLEKFGIVSGNSGGSWFMTLMLYSTPYNNYLLDTTTTNKNTYFETYMNGVFDAIDKFRNVKNNNALEIALEAIIPGIDSIFRPFFYYLGTSWTQVVETIVLSPAGIKNDTAAESILNKYKNKYNNNIIPVWAGCVMRDGYITHKLGTDFLRLTYDLTDPDPNCRGPTSMKESVKKCGIALPITLSYYNKENTFPISDVTPTLIYSIGDTPINTDNGKVYLNNTFCTGDDKVSNYCAISGAAVGAVSNIDVLTSLIQNIADKFPGFSKESPGKEKPFFKVVKATLYVSIIIPVLGVVTYLILRITSPETLKKVSPHVVNTLVVLTFIWFVWAIYVISADEINKIISDLLSVSLSAVNNAAIPFKIVDNKEKTKNLSFYRDGKIPINMNIKTFTGKSTPPIILRGVDGGYFDNTSIYHAIRINKEINKPTPTVNILFSNSITDAPPDNYEGKFCIPYSGGQSFEALFGCPYNCNNSHPTSPPPPSPQNCPSPAPLVSGKGNQNYDVKLPTILTNAQLVKFQAATNKGGTTNAQVNFCHYTASSADNSINYNFFVFNIYFPDAPIFISPGSVTNKDKDIYINYETDAQNKIHDLLSNKSIYNYINSKIN